MRLPPISISCYLATRDFFGVWVIFAIAALMGFLRGRLTKRAGENPFLKLFRPRIAANPEATRRVLGKELNSSTIKKLLEDELARKEPFDNSHGITAQNVRSFLVEPFPVWTDPDDLETNARTMWVVLQERPKPTEGYVIVYDPLTETWKLAEHLKEDQYQVVVGGPSFAQALDGM